MSNGLYRDPVNGRLAGVCAGIANYFGLEIWIVRLIVISMFILGGYYLVFFAYVGLALMLEKAPPDSVKDRSTTFDHVVKEKPWKKGSSAGEVIKNLDIELQHIDRNIRRIEAYVTSNAYDVNRKFRDL